MSPIAPNWVFLICSMQNEVGTFVSAQWHCGTVVPPFAAGKKFAVCTFWSGVDSCLFEFKGLPTCLPLESSVGRLLTFSCLDLPALIFLLRMVDIRWCGPDGFSWSTFSRPRWKQIRGQTA